MKVNEAPEKIYLQDSMSTDTIGDLWPEWFDAEVSDNSIEYTRTDAFIEKACEWLKSNLYNYAGEDDKRNIVPFDSSIFEDFKKYMEGE